MHHGQQCTCPHTELCVNYHGKAGMMMCMTQPKSLLTFLVAGNSHTDVGKVPQRQRKAQGCQQGVARRHSQQLSMLHKQAGTTSCMGVSRSSRMRGEAR